MLSVDANSTNGSSVPMTNSSQPADGSNAIVKPPELEGLEKEGCLLWAKIRGYSYWPGVVTVDPLDGLTIKGTEAGSGTSGSKKGSSKCRVHVHFLGYDNMRAWVAGSNVMPYEGKAAYDQLAMQCSKQKAKDYFPTKKYQRLFDKAVKEAEETLALPMESRLKKLGM